MQKLKYILFFFLSVLAGFVFGLYFTILTGVAEGQGLAAGAILIFNAVTGFVLALILAIFVALKVKPTSIVTSNKLLLICNVVLITGLIVIIKCSY